MGVVAAVATVASSVYGVVSGVQQAREARKINKASAEAERIQAFRQRVNAIRRMRLTAASAENQAAVEGVPNASSVQGQIGALQTNQAAEISFANQLDTLRSRQLDAQAAAERAGLINSITSQVGRAVSK